MEKTDVSKEESAGTSSISALQLEWLQELHRRAYQSRIQWKTTLFQAEAVFLSIFVPLSLRNNPTGQMRLGILLSALMSILSLISGTLALTSESRRAENRESRERDRIQRGGSGIQLYDTEQRTGSWVTGMFVVYALLSLVILYLTLDGFPKWMVQIHHTVFR